MELFDYWRDYPPMHWLMAAYVGYKPPSKPTEQIAKPTATKLSKARGVDRDIFEELKAFKPEAVKRGG